MIAADITDRFCECHMLEVLSQFKEFPIRYDQNSKTYNIHGWHMIHCTFCGGRLPEASVEDRPKCDPREEEEALRITASLKCEEEVWQVLGEPDEITPWIAVNGESGISRAFALLQEKYPDLYTKDPDGNWQRILRYYRRWPSLNVDVYVYQPERIETHIWPQHPGDWHPPKPQTKRWWQWWKQPPPVS